MSTPKKKPSKPSKPVVKAKKLINDHDQNEIIRELTKPTPLNTDVVSIDDRIMLARHIYNKINVGLSEEARKLIRIQEIDNKIDNTDLLVDMLATRIRCVGVDVLNHVVLPMILPNHTAIVCDVVQHTTSEDGHVPIGTSKTKIVRIITKSSLQEKIGASRK